MSVRVFSKDGKPARVVTTAAEETAAVFEGFREVKAEDSDEAGDQRTDTEREADEQAAKAKAESAKANKPAAPKPAAPKTN
jgi:Mg-chelatase subunit ChlI